MGIPGLDRPAPSCCASGVTVMKLENWSKELRRDVRTVIISVAASSLVIAAPAAAIVANAHKVDGKHAVDSAATATTRAGKLVATDGEGFLPNSIIRKAPDAETLDGVDSSEFARTSSPTYGYAQQSLSSRRTLDIPSGVVLTDLTIRWLAGDTPCWVYLKELVPWGDGTAFVAIDSLYPADGRPVDMHLESGIPSDGDVGVTVNAGCTIHTFWSGYTP